MDKETAKYVIDYFSYLLTGEEKLAIKHTMSNFKLQSSSSHKPTLTRIYQEKGWLTKDQDVLDLLKEGYDNFELRVANRILREHRDKVYFNKCPKCKKLARTPQARQCRYCGYDWHNLTVAQFKLNSTFQLHGRQFYLLGEITKGEVKIVYYIDLTMLGLNCKPRIEAIESAFKKVDRKTVEDVALGTNELNEEQKEFLKRKEVLGTSIDILKEI